MPDEKTDVVPTKDQIDMALCAVRYTLGRMTYVVSDGQRWALRYGRHSAWMRGVLIRDIREASPNRLGSEEDARGWWQVLAELEAMEAVSV